MLDDLSVVVESEDLYPGPIVVARPLPKAVRHSIVALRDDPLEGNSLAWILSRHAFKIIDEGLLAVRHGRIVLSVSAAGAFRDGLSGLALVCSDAATVEA